MLRGGLDSALSHVMRIVYCWILFAARAHSGTIHLFFFINNYTIRTYTRLYFTCRCSAAFKCRNASASVRTGVGERKRSLGTGIGGTRWQKSTICGWHVTHRR